MPRRASHKCMRQLAASITDFFTKRERGGAVDEYVKALHDLPRDREAS